MTGLSHADELKEDRPDPEYDMYVELLLRLHKGCICLSTHSRISNSWAHMLLKLKSLLAIL